MRASPEYEAFAPVYNAGKAQVVATTLISDLETPVSAMMKLVGGEPLSFLLESVEGGKIRGRYSFLGMRPDLIWRCYGNRAEINRSALADAKTFAPCPIGDAKGTLASFRAILAESRIDMPDGLPPMAAGLVGYLGYDAVRLAEKIPDTNPDAIGAPDGQFIRPTIIAVFDTIEDEVTIVTPVWPAKGVSAEQAYEAALSRLGRVLDDFDRAVPHQQTATDLTDLPDPVSNMTAEQFMDIVKRGKEYVLAGDVFQVVLSQRYSVPFDLPPLAFYRALRRINPSPFLFFQDFGDFSIVGSSPELLVRLREGKVTIRPLAGTRPRGKNAAEDKRLVDDLLSDPKELAEHLMLLDLGRNDVGRVSKVGTVKVTEQMVTEFYSHVMHIVSNVEGEIDSKWDAIDALLAGFPAGTVSGAPKVRAMEIIDELETVRRGIYAGCIGYFGADGDMDTCIALRTAVLKDKMLYMQAGAGVVADSDPASENQECRNKAMALVRAAQEAVRYSQNRN
jgi:anthranilate synthase component 1